MEIEILNTHKNDFSPVIGERTMELLSRFGQKLDEDGIDTLSSETIEILSHCTNPYKNEVQSVTNLVVGYVQSGKTMSFTTLSALAHDNGFRIIIYFAGTNIHKKPDNRKPDCARFGKGFRQRKARSSDRAFRKKQDGMPALFGRIFS